MSSRFGLRTVLGNITNRIKTVNANNFQFDPDAVNFFNAVGTLDAVQEGAINKLVVDLKAFGIYSKMFAIYPFIGGTAASHKFNLKDPRDIDAAFRITFAGGWVHDNTDGITPNGVNTTGNTHFIMQNTNLNNFSLGYYTTTAVMQASQDGLFTFGAVQGPTQVYGIIINRTGLNLVSDLGRDTQLASFNNNNVALTGLAVGSRITNISNKVYFDGVLKGTGPASNNSGTFTTISMKFGNPTVTVFTTMNCSFGFIAEGLNDTQNANLFTAVDTYQTTLNRG